MSGPGDEAGATALLHTQALVSGSGGDLGAPPSGIVLPTKQKRPKRKQVKRACSNCRKSHSGCDDLRPCSRCIDNGLESSCADVPRKKRATRRKTPGDPSELGDGAPPGMPEMVCQDRTCQDSGRTGKMLGRSSSELMAGLGSAAAGLAQHHQHQHHPMGAGQQAAAAAAGLPPAVSSHPLRLKTEPSTADHGGLLAAPLPSKASDLTAGMNKANNYQSLVTELSDLRRYNTRLEHTLQNILVEVQQLRSRSEVEAAAAAGTASNNGGVRVKPEPDHHQQHHLQPTPAGVMTSASGGGGQSASAAAAAAAAAAANFHSFGSEVPGIATWRVHDSTLLECNDRFMEIVQQPLDTLKNNFKCLQLFPQRLYDEFIGFKQAVLYGGGNSNPSKESYFMLPDGREKPVLMTLQALKHEENVSPQFMVMHVVELLPLPVTTPPGGEADFISAHVHRATTGEHVIDSYASSSGASMSSADAPLGSSTVTSITELDPAALHMPSPTTTTTTTTTTTPSSSSSPASSMSLSSPSMLSSTSLPPSSAHQPQHQGQQQQQQQHSLSL